MDSIVAINARKELSDDVKKSDEWKKVEESYKEYVKLYYSHFKHMLKYQKCSAWLIMFLVISITLAGLFFSFFQLIRVYNFSN